MSRSIWATLGIKSTRDRAEIRRAYSSRLKVTNPEDDPEGFQALREAYERALALVQHSDLVDAEAPAGPVLAEADIDAELDRLEPAAGPVGNDPDIGALAAIRAEEDAHKAACERLQALVAAETAPDEAAVVEAFKAVVRSPAMGSVHIHDWTEGFLAWLIHSYPPATDPLIWMAVDEFGWDHNRIGQRLELSEQLIARRRMLDGFASLAKRTHPQHAAYMALKTAPDRWRRIRNRFSPSLEGDVRKILNGLQREDPSLLMRLDQAALAWWRRHLTRPHLSAYVLWAMIVGPILGIGMVSISESESRNVAIGLAAALVVGIWAAALGWLYGLAVPRAWWLNRPQQPKLWQRAGWSGLLLAALALAALAPASIPVTVVAAVLGAVAAVWASVTGDRDTAELPGPRWTVDGANSVIAAVFLMFRPVFQPFVRTPWRLRALFAFGWLAVFWLLIANEIAPAAWAQMTPPLAAMALAYMAGSETLVELWDYRLNTVQRRAALIAGAAATAGAALLLWFAAPGPQWVPPAAALVAVLVFLQKIPGAGITHPDLRTWRDVSLRYGWFPWFIATAWIGEGSNQGNLALLGGGLWLLTGVAISIVAGLRAEPLSRAQPS